MANLLLTASPSVLAERFERLGSVADIATLLEVRVDQLKHYTYGRGYRYRTFSIKKRRGGSRIIKEPCAGLKALQQKLAQVLAAVYTPPNCVHGFVEGRSIATNAQQHTGAEWVLNVDIKNFFPSINFGRVQGLFIRRYRLPENVASVLARICVHANELPQGAPTSPVIANMIAGALDKKLHRLARRFRCVYTRYADDLTFSCNRRFPEALGYWDPVALPSRQSRIGDLLQAAVTDNGFEVNLDKVSLRFRDERQTVTGLVVNLKVNIRRGFMRRIRAMLHAWRKYGETAAEAEYFDRYDNKDRAPHATLSFRRIVKGHIDYLGMIRGTDDGVYQHFIREYATLVPGYLVRPPSLRRPNHLRTWKDAIWVIETTESQGTAFELDGFGLVTCAHVVRDTTSAGHTPYPDPFVYHRSNPALKYPVSIVEYDATLDLAILEFDAPSGCALKPKPAPMASVGERIKTAGFPDHGTGAVLWEDSGRITQVRRFNRVSRYIVSCPIVVGASGSPVMDESGRVIAIATTGARSFSDTAARATGDDDVPDYGAVPIHYLQTLIAPASQPQVLVPAGST